jgi:hypothetical protein
MQFIILLLLLLLLLLLISFVHFPIALFKGGPISNQALQKGYILQSTTALRSIHKSTNLKELYFSIYHFKGVHFLIDHFQRGLFSNRPFKRGSSPTNHFKRAHFPLENFKRYFPVKIMYAI